MWKSIRFLNVGRCSSEHLRWALTALFCVTLATDVAFFGSHLAAQEKADMSGDVAAEVSPVSKISEVDRSTVRRLVRRLESDGVAERDAAERQLVELGVGILEHLPTITARTSGELKIRLQRIRQSFENASIEEFFEASKISLSGIMKLTEALSKISEQTQNSISLQGEGGLQGVEVELAAEEEEFWIVMESLMSQAGLRIVSFGTTGDELVLASGGGPEEVKRGYHTGPFRVEPMFVQATRPFNSNAPGQLQVSLQVTWEPRLEPVFMQIPMSSVLGVASGEAELRAISPQAAPEIPLNYGGCTTQVDLQLERPERSKQKITSLAGEFVVAVPGESRRFEFKDFGNGARQSEAYGDLTVILEGARRNGRNYEIRLLVEFGNAQGALDSYRGWVMSNKAYVLDPGGRRLDDVGFNTYAMTNNALGIAYLFSISGDPSSYTLVYEAPATITKQTVRYQLADIPLP